MTHVAIFDTECYHNYWLCKFYNPATGGIAEFELYEGHPLDKVGLRKVMETYELVSFNGIHYDMPMIALALSGASNEELKKANDEIIKDGLRSWQIEQRYEIEIPKVNHIDLIEVAPGVMDSLKIYGGRLHTKKMQDLPYRHDTVLTPEQMKVVKEYCGNDTQGLTFDLYKALEKALNLRRKMSEKYGIDLRSKSDPQIAETVVCSEIEKRQDAPVKRSEAKPGMTFKYVAPPFIKFQTDYLNNVLQLILDSTFTVQNNGSVIGLNETLNEPIEIRETKYQLGIGGLHSCESNVCHKSDAYTLVAEEDVTSYYPYIILLCSLFPKHIGEIFLEIYRELVETKLRAAEVGDTDIIESCKVQINGLFGKLGSIFSKFFSPDLLLQITLTGQLASLMLIESLELCGIPVVSANTDGILIRCPRNRVEERDSIVSEWESNTGCSMKEAKDAAIYSRDVNNYIAIKQGGKFKRKGVFGEPDLKHNPKNEICTDAVIAYLSEDIPIADTVKQCADIRKFIEVRRVNGGAMYGATVTKTKNSLGLNEEGIEKFETITSVEGGTLIGKAIRWYHSTLPVEPLVDGKTGNRIASSEGGMPCMELPETLPDDIDYDWYINEAESMLRGIGLNESYLQHKLYF